MVKAVVTVLRPSDRERYSVGAGVKNRFSPQRLMTWAAKAYLGLAVAELLCSCGPKHPVSETEPARGAVSTNATPAVRPNPAYEQLAGRWQRPDGGYILEISTVQADGKLQAAYFNPGPINVARALAFKEGDTTKVFVELRDAGYPGCTYSLKYDPQTDQLFGDYFQAAMQETFNVTFARLKER